MLKPQYDRRRVFGPQSIYRHRVKFRHVTNRLTQMFLAMRLNNQLGCRINSILCSVQLQAGI